MGQSEGLPLLAIDDGKYMVVFFGDQTKGELKLSQIKEFENNFETLKVQKKDKLFKQAISEALEYKPNIAQISTPLVEKKKPKKLQRQDLVELQDDPFVMKFQKYLQKKDQSFTYDLTAHVLNLYQNDHKLIVKILCKDKQFIKYIADAERVEYLKSQVEVVKLELLPIEYKLFF
ncbi:hypothetical protein pb186bvf_007298 [Paramecium bursaria]